MQKGWKFTQHHKLICIHKLRQRLFCLTVCPSSLGPITHWQQFNIQRQVSMPGNSADRATNTHYQCLYSNTSNTRIQRFSTCCSIYGNASTREDESSKWLHPASPLTSTIIGWCFAAGVDAVMLRSEENGNKRTVWN